MKTCLVIALLLLWEHLNHIENIKRKDVMFVSDFYIYALGLISALVQWCLQS